MNTSSGKVCFYILKVDTGFAPNPFHGVCTLAICTPNHMRANLVKGDLIAGCFRGGLPPRVVYVLEVDEVLSLDAYYRDARFAKKKPLRDGTWMERAGDNIYFLRNGEWCQDPNAQHHRKEENPRVFNQDVLGDRVYIGKQFVYFGGEAKPLPDQFLAYLPATQGIKYLQNDPDTFDAFRKWAFERPMLGLIGSPRDQETPETCSKPKQCKPPLIVPPPNCNPPSARHPR